MKSIKQQYIDLREGNMTQANFMRNLRMTLPQYVTNVTSFEDSVRILKNKGILTEADEKSKDPYIDTVNAIAKKYSYKVYHDEIEEFMKDNASLDAIAAGKDPIVAYEEFYNIQRESLNEAKDEKGKWTNTSGKSMYDQFKEIDNLNGQEVLIGIDYEMECNHELSKKEAAKIVIKNLKKNPIYYTSTLMSGKEGYEPEYIGGKSAQPEAHQMQPLEKNLGNIVDKKRGMQPVKGIEKPKKDSDKGGETNKMEKGVSLMSLIAKSTRGVKKMDATGEKMKKVSMKEVKLNDFPNETPGKIATQIKNFVDSNPTLQKYSDEIILQSNPDGFLRFRYWDSLPSDAFKALSLQFDIKEDSDFDEDTGTLTYYRLTPKHKMSDVNLGGSFEKFKDQLKEMIRKEMKEALGIGGGDNVTDVAGHQLDENWITPQEVEEDYGFYSDMYKEEHGFRPRIPAEQLADWLNSTFKLDGKTIVKK